MGNKFKVEVILGNNWHDAEWTYEDTPMRFDSEQEAEDEIKEFIIDSDAAFGIGHYTAAMYRVVPA